jgi:hypothetical protein
MADKIIPTGRVNSVTTSVRLGSDNTTITLVVDGIPATNPVIGQPDIPGRVQVTLGSNIHLNGFDNAVVTDNHDGTVKLTLTSALVSKKPNTSPDAVISRNRRKPGKKNVTARAKSANTKKAPAKKKAAKKKAVKKKK